MSETLPPSSNTNTDKKSQNLSSETTARIHRLVVAACVLSLVALGLIAWSLLQPRPIPVIMAMSVGQALGTLSLILFIATMVIDLRGRRILGRRESAPPPPPPPTTPPPPE